jgi:hypothetical protein
MPSTAIDTGSTLTSGFPDTNAPLKPNSVVGNVLLADVNAGYTVVPANPSRTLRPIGFFIRVNGAWTTGTDVRISDTAASPVDIVTFAQANLTNANTFTGASQTGQTLGAGFLVPLTAGKGIQFRSTGSAMAAGTSIDYRIDYIEI